MQKSKANKKTPRTGRGFSTVELLITAAVLTIVTGLGLMGITRAKASIRLAGAAREYASNVEKARLFSIRSHADNEDERARVAINDDKTSYNVMMDLDGDGGMDTRTVTLPSGITFETVETIAFDWRGRTWNTVGAITSSNAQVSIRLKSDSDSVSIDVTGSGDITIDSKVFDDSVPNVTLNVGDLAAGATTVPTPDPTVTTPPVDTNPPIDPKDTTPPVDPPVDPTDPTDPVDPVDPTDPSTNPGGNTPKPNPTPTPKATPQPTPTPVVCNLTTNLPSLTLSLEGTATIKVGHDFSGSLAISGTSSKPSELQVSAGQTVNVGSTGTFTVKSKKTTGIYSITFNSSCGSKTVGVVVTSLGISLGL